ncbi:acyl carrier protein [Flavobacterium album]|uniref:Acyl carrier protein n=1 Tax=Flavobacterium album TaxID=2175091 RepID=A0A2S1R023_9FLAO|nr:phosphopantetheine-binding protein [Flavobacterium album]AWH86027.1 acyl carrier protein [Flavobacterium album]
MNKEQITGKLKAIIKPYTSEVEVYDKLTEDTDFINDLKINSANLVDIVLDIETAFDIRIENEEMERMLTVKAALDIIEAKLAEK